MDAKVENIKSLAHRYRAARALSEILAAPLSPEDACVQSMPDASPAKWHLAHTTWFFECFVLTAHLSGYESYDSRFFYLFNSYYETLGPRHPRPERGLLTRPSLEEVIDYRHAVDDAVLRLLRQSNGARQHEIDALIELGIQHEQQHQELLLTDIKHAFSLNPLKPTYVKRRPDAPSAAMPMNWLDHPGGIVPTGHSGTGFAFDNETPRHQVLLPPHRLAARPVTNGEYRAFMEDDGYRRTEFWLSDGWAMVRAQGWEAPLYWLRSGNEWETFTLNGVLPVEKDEPVTHISFYEACAYAAWSGKRLPTEFEWEAAAVQQDVSGNFLDPDRVHPRAATGDALYGDVWTWTRSSYEPYPGFKPLAGAVGEYNAKFMCGQMVLRGGSCATPEGHVRATYRNFFPPHARWQFSGIRLAEDA